MDNRVNSVLIAGNGSAAYITALVLKKRMPFLTVSIVGPQKNGAMPIGESTTVLVPYLLNILNIDRHIFENEVKPVYKMSARFDFGPGEYFDYSLSRYLDKYIGQYPASYYVHKTKKYDSSCYNSFVINQGKILPNDPHVGFGYHVKAERFLSFLKKECTSNSIRVFDGVVDIVKEDGNNIHYITTDQGRMLGADLYIDCTGSKRVLLDSLNASWIPYSDTLACNTALICNRLTEEIIPSTIANKMNNGWMWSISHRDSSTVHGYVFSNNHISEDDAAIELEAKVNVSSDDFKLVNFQSGHLDKAWIGNVVGIGSSAVFIDPMESTGQHLNIMSINILTELLYNSSYKINNKIIDIYNKLNSMNASATRDFIELHYKFCSGPDTKFWKDMNNIELKNIAKEVTDWYYYMGPTFTDNIILMGFKDVADYFGLNGWFSVLMGCGAPTIWENPVSDNDLMYWDAHLKQQQFLVSQLQDYSSK